MQNARILIVEDEVIIAYDLQHKLQLLGYQVLEICSSGEEAIEYVKTAAPDLILMDIRLHGTMSGIDAAEHILNHHDIPIIYLTAHADQNTLQKAKMTHPFGYLVKPIDDEKYLHGPIEIALYKHQIDLILKERESWFSSTLRSIEDAVVTTDREGNIMVLNPKAEELTGYSQAEAAHQFLEALIPFYTDGEPIRMAEWMQNTIRTGKPGILPEGTILKNAKNQVYHIEGIISPVISENKIVYGAVLSFRDVSKRKQSELKFRQIVESSPMGMHMYRLDETGRLIFTGANPAADAILGVSNTLVMGKTIEEAFPSLAGTDIPDIYKKVCLEGESFHREDLFYKDRHFQGNYEVHAFQTAPHMMTAIFLDVTGRKQMEDSLRMTQYSLDHVGEGAFWIHKDASIADVNETACRMLGYSHDELLEMKLTEIEPDLSPASWRNYWRHLKKEKILVTETGQKTRTGRLIPVEVIGNYIEYNGKQYIFRVVRNIEERQATLYALKESEEKYRSLVELASDGIVILQNELIRFANNRIYEMLDIPASRLLGSSWLEYVPPEEHPMILEYYKKRLRGDPVPRTFETRIIVQRHKTLPVEISAGRIKFHEEESFLVFIRDISERKKAELALQQAQSTYHLASLGTLAAGISHEINQPLTALKLKVDGLLYWGNENPEILQKNLRSNLQFITEQADEIDKIIRHMRSLIYQEKSPPRPIDVNQTIQKACRLVEQRLMSHNISLELKLSRRNPVVMALETPLEQIVINLMTNAINALDRKQIVKKQILIRTHVCDSLCIIEFTDNGPGIPEPDLVKIFDPLFTTETNGKGMGLGLSIVQELLKQFKGSIKADNRKTGGVMMTVQLPLIPKK
jgi:PAS domain S-box-containing protein